MRSIVNLRQAQQTLEESRALLDIHDTQITLIAARAKAGLIDHTLLTRAQAERAQTATQLPIAQAMHDGAIYQIEQLMGVPSGALRERIVSTQGELAVPPASETINITLESMRDRPDIRSARSDMLAAKSDLAKAEADLWPRISIKSFFGVQEVSEGVPVAANPLWSLSSGITMPILNFGRLHRAIDAADARAQSAIAGYERASLIALAETNTALSDYLTGINALEHQEDAFALRTHTVQLATTRYDRGFTDMTDLTTAQSELNQATLSLIARKATVAYAYIRLHKALGVL
ncbi:MAG: TolC family protein [Alphaproteobacteria bacterium]|nr:MAG: TolC family protein [Alphaproteobacteria bacterium]